MRWQKGKHLLCALSLSNIYTVCWVETLPKSAMNHLGLEGDPIKIIIIMLSDNNTNTEKTLNVRDKYNFVSVLYRQSLIFEH